MKGSHDAMTSGPPILYANLGWMIDYGGMLPQDPTIGAFGCGKTTATGAATEQASIRAVNSIAPPVGARQAGRAIAPARRARRHSRSTSMRKSPYPNEKRDDVSLRTIMIPQIATAPAAMIPAVTGAATTPAATTGAARNATGTTDVDIDRLTSGWGTWMERVH